MLSDTATAPRSPAFETVVRTLLLTDLVGSTQLVGKLGDIRASEIATLHDRAFRDLLPRYNGLEIDKSDGFLLLFERPHDAVGYALAYHQTLAELSDELGVELEARAGIHLGEVLLRKNSPDDVSRGAKRLEVEGIAKPIAARLMALARGNQTLLTRGAFDLARRSTVDPSLPSRDLIWLAHGAYRFKGVEEPMEVFEAGVVGTAPLAVPPDYGKARRIVAEDDEITLGWRPAPDQEIPLRPNWTLAGRLGEGGFGEVWLGRHKKTGEKRVFKFCYEARKLRSLQREAALFRLLKETLGQRDDIARILDWNFDQAPYFLESEYTEGGNLVEWAQQEGGLDRVPLAIRLELIAQVADALAAAHSVGVLHKDVKPSNVLVTTDRRGALQVRLTDFGIGQVMDKRVFAEQGITVLGLTEISPETGPTSNTGTQLYMAPELLEGKPPTVQADIYALGVMLYQMVAGDLSHALAPGWRRDIPDDFLAEDIALMVDGSPERRPSSARTAAERLRQLEQRRAEAESAIAREQAHRRWKLFASFGAVAGVVLVIVSVLALQATNAKREADLRRGQAEDLIDFMLGDLRKKLRPVGRLDILNDVADKALDYFAAVPEEDLTSEEVLRHSQALLHIGHVRTAEGQPESALAAFEASLNLVQNLVHMNPENAEWQNELGTRHFWVGKVLWDRGDLDGALERFTRQLLISRDLLNKEPSNQEWQLSTARAHTNIGFFKKDVQGDLEGALSAFLSTLQLKKQLAESDPEDAIVQLSLADQYNLVGWVLMESGHLAEALDHFEADHSLAARMAEHDPHDAIWQEQLAHSHNYIGKVQQALYQQDSARTHFLSHLDIAKKLVAVDGTNRSWRHHLAVAHRRVGLDLLTQGRVQQASHHTGLAREILEALVSENPTRRKWKRDLAAAHLGFGETLLRQGNYAATREQVAAALAILDAIDRERSGSRQTRRWLCKSYILEARALSALGQNEASKAAWEKAAEIIEPFARDSMDFHFLEPWSEALSHIDREKEFQKVRSKLETIRRAK